MERLPPAQLIITGRGRAPQKPADNGNPDAIKPGPAERSPENYGYTTQNKQEAYPLPQPHGNTSRAAIAPGKMPEQGAKDTPAIQRETGYQIEGGQ